MGVGTGGEEVGDDVGVGVADDVGAGADEAGAAGGAVTGPATTSSGPDGSARTITVAPSATAATTASPR
ncbi:hypothetical protein ABZ815_17165 [Nonomuraea sp. NPDC047529]|uniref:hypothetical protein n=1 Tax=Nonomuraea sp. NPDC047529 TaxID=3155623 RepID=UPI0033ED90AD